MFTLVTERNLRDAIEEINRESEKGCDTETYTHTPDKRLFALQIATAQDVFYFNYHDYGDETPVLNKFVTLNQIDWSKRDDVWFIHNAKFDTMKLSYEGIQILGGHHCTQMAARFEYNQHMSYSLDSCLKRIGLAKNDKVAAYIKEHKLYTDGEPRYDLVPFDIMFEYGCMDARDVRVLGKHQRDKLRGKAFYENDLQLNKVLLKMEQTGMKVRSQYALGGLQYEKEKQQEASDRLSTLAGEPFRSGPTWLRAYFDRLGVQYSTNPKTGNPIFDKAALDEIDHPAAALVRQYRRHEKYASTYYQHYVNNPVVHAFIKSWGTDTGRFSYADPNLQNVPKEEELAEDIPFQVRGCFEPREGFCFTMIDYDQQEFRLLLDYAGEKELIREIIMNGLDVHQATANMVGITRKQAKTLNFGLLYGMGAEKLAKALNVDLLTAKLIKEQYFAKLPRVKSIIRRIIEKAEREKVVKTWCGRELHFPIKDFAYAAPNHLIQGGCGDIARFAMTAIDDYLTEKKCRSRMLLQVHDELIFETHENELDIVDDIKGIMENIYKPYNGMYLTCGVDHSWVSWGKRDVITGKPIPKAS